MEDREKSDVDTSDANDQDQVDLGPIDQDQPDQDQTDQIDRQSPQIRTDEVLLTEQKSGQESEHAEVGANSLHAENSIAQETRSDEETLAAADSELTIHDLIDGHSKFLLGYAYRLAGSVADSEDLTQQTFLIAYQKLNQLRSPSAAKSWLCAILRSCWLKSIRRNSPVPASNFEFELGEMLIDESTQVEFDSQAVKIALAELPPDYRLVLLMYYFEELSYQEIADKLEVKIGTVMSRLSRAKERVRRRLGNKENLLDQ